MFNKEQICFPISIVIPGRCRPLDIPKDDAELWIITFSKKTFMPKSYLSLFHVKNSSI